MRAHNPFKRAVRVPPEILTRADLAHGERVLAGTLAADGTWLLGTRDAFLAVSEQAPTRIPWEHVERADELDFLQAQNPGEAYVVPRAGTGPLPVPAADDGVEPPALHNPDQLDLLRAS